MNNQHSLKLNDIILDLILDLRSEKDEAGNRKYTEEQIEKFAEKLEKLFKDNKLKLVPIQNEQPTNIQT